MNEQLSKEIFRLNSLGKANEYLEILNMELSKTPNNYYLY